MGDFFAELKRRNVIRVGLAYVAVSWLVIQVIETLFPMFGVSNDSGRTIVIILAIGFLPVLVLSWVFELTPEGVKRDAEAAPSSPTRKRTARQLDRLIIVVLAVAVVFFAFDRFLLDPARDKAREVAAADRGRTEALVSSYGDRSIAVLPFVNMSSDPEQEYFSDGIAEELLNLLARIKELRVISRSSAFAFKGKDIDVPEIAKQLNVAHILEGSVRKSGDRIRITVQLIEARSDTHLWSETYDRKLDDIFAIQDEIAEDIVEKLQVTLVQPTPKTRKTDPETFALTLQAKQLFYRRAERTGRNMADLLDQALAIDPNYVPALVARIQSNYLLMKDEEISPEEDWRRYRVLSDRVLTMEPDNGYVQAANGFGMYVDESEFESAAQFFGRAYKYAYGDSEVLRLVGMYARFIGRMDDSLTILERATANDPLCYMCLYQLSVSQMFARKYDDALQTRQRFIRLGTGGQYYLGRLMLFRDDPAAALLIFEGEGLNETKRRSGRAMALHDLGRTSESDAVMAGMVEDGDDPLGAAEAYAWRGDNDLAFENLDRAYDVRPFSVQRLVFAPIFQKLHDDPRWTEFREKIGMSEERLAAIEFNVDLSD